MINTINTINVSSDAYACDRQLQVRKIIRLFEYDKNIMFSKNNWFVLCGVCFNGFTLEHLSQIIDLSEAIISYV